MNLWYGHLLVEKWLLTAKPAGAPEDMLAYAERGWPHFERAVCELQTKFSRLLDLGRINGSADNVDDYELISDACQLLERGFPALPSDFTEALESVVFTNGSDKEFVSKKYAQTIEEIIG